MLAIVDSGGANIASVKFALERLGVRGELTTDTAVIAAADRVILPGVGSAAEGMKRLQQRGLVDCVRALRQPVLGICLGMQLLYEASEEDDVRCLGVIPGVARRFTPAPDRPVPHMGWNRIQPLAAVDLLAGIAAGSHCYFVHSYALPVTTATIATASYGREFAAVAQERNFLATQFHPERSGRTGAAILANFLNRY